MKVYQLKPPAPAAEFCRTPAAEGMLSVVGFARELSTIGAIVGAPGVGKTTALRWYADTNRDARYCVMSPAESSMSRMLIRVCEALGHPPAAQGAAQLHRWICDAIEFGSARVLLIDEAQHLDDRSLDELRCIHDETGLPLVFAGNESLRSRIGVGTEASFAQFTSRIGARVHIKGSTAADVGALLGRHGITDEVTASWLAKRCAGTAGLRTVAHLMAAAKLSAGPGDIRLSHLKEAGKALGVGS